MKVPLSWLADYVPLKLPPVELAHRLTMAGIETTFVPGKDAEWGPVYVGEVVRLEKHPNADRLRLATVSIGGETLRVVCGAPNIAQGQRIAFAKTGARLTDSHTGTPMTLGAAKIRGVESQGMVCSERELGLGNDHDGILVLPPNAPIGTPLADYLSDAHLDIEVTTNRGDCLSVLGVAREVGAITGVPVPEPSLDYPEGTEPVSSAVRVQIDAPDLCSRYLAAVIKGVKVGPSPEWLQQRLKQAGLRPINNVVDATNYVMLEYGQPLHAFDLRQVRRDTIVVRQARPGERFTTLDGVEHTLQPPMLLIADPERAIALAGVMGGANSEMTEATTDVLLESATFNGINIRRTAQQLKLRTEASTRFEKGLQSELAGRAVRRAARLILRTAGGAAMRGIADAFPAAGPANRLRLSRSGMTRLIGTAALFDGIPGRAPGAGEVLRALGFAVQQAGHDALTVTPPYWRSDIAIEEDVIEEVARIVGYDNVPAEPLAGRMPATLTQPLRELRERVKDLLVDAGMQETISYSLIGHRTLEQALAVGPGKPEPLRAANPLSREQEYLRTSLRGNLLRTLAAALRVPPGGARIFEAGRVYIPRAEDLPDEREIVAGALAGTRGDSLWEKGADPFDFHDAKGVVESVLARLGLDAAFERAEDDLLHPGRTARITVDGEAVGVLGELHPLVTRTFDLTVAKVAFFEIDLNTLQPRVPWLTTAFKPFSRLPSADRDVALLVDESVPAGRVQRFLEDHPLVRRVALFDRFVGKGLPAGKLSLAYRLEFQSGAGTLSAEQVNEAMSSLLQRLQAETGATLRA
ncbi:MAG: phenylalanine--tRNA ligase subunit beta [SAR202 cluster bacterium]|nr:phenylalanine--tRNA ligase subunit beta [SAR202 cluster bacterium]